MADDERRAEVEAVMLVLWPEFRVHDTVHRRRANDVIDALDRVRDARGDDEAETRHDLMDRYFCPNGHPFAAPRAIRCNECRAHVAVVPMAALIEAREAARSPQGEDHERNDERRP